MKNSNFNVLFSIESPLLSLLYWLRCVCVYFIICLCKMCIFASAGPNQLRPFLETPVGIKLINSFLFLFSLLFVMLLFFFLCFARLCYIIMATDRDIKIFDNWSQWPMAICALIICILLMWRPIEWCVDVSVPQYNSIIKTWNEWNADQSTTEQSKTLNDKNILPFKLFTSFDWFFWNAQINWYFQIGV